jgi:hypothetical protein
MESVFPLESVVILIQLRRFCATTFGMQRVVTVSQQSAVRPRVIASRTTSEYQTHRHAVLIVGVALGRTEIRTFQTHFAHSGTQSITCSNVRTLRMLLTIRLGVMLVRKAITQSAVQLTVELSIVLKARALETRRHLVLLFVSLATGPRLIAARFRVVPRKCTLIPLNVSFVNND